MSYLQNGERTVEAALIICGATGSLTRVRLISTTLMLSTAD